MLEKMTSLHPLALAESQTGVHSRMKLLRGDLYLIEVRSLTCLNKSFPLQRGKTNLQSCISKATLAVLGVPRLQFSFCCSCVPDSPNSACSLYLLNSCWQWAVPLAYQVRSGGRTDERRVKHERLKQWRNPSPLMSFVDKGTWQWMKSPFLCTVCRPIIDASQSESDRTC